jgi:hypothetical protein
MRINKLAVLVATLTLAFSVAYAQHGHSGGGGAPAGAGSSIGSTMSGDHGSSASTGHGMSDSHMPSTTGSSMGKQSPDTILSKNTKLSGNLEKLLPAGTTAQQACSGFKNLGQCVAAIHVSHNLDIPFADLKSKITGGDSLGKSIEALKPSSNAKAEAKKGQKQAEADLNDSNS